jgi:soluble lytic murein transglycosylase-like protein
MRFNLVSILRDVRLKALFRLAVLAVAICSAVILHGRALAPSAHATETDQLQSPAEVLGMTSGDEQIDRMILEAGAKHGVDPKLIYYVIQQESRFKVNAKSGKNAQGLMQMIPATAERFKVEDVYDPEQNIEGGVKYLRWLLKRFDGNVNLALAGYNAGEGAVERNGNRIPDFEETKNYVAKITRNYGKTYHPVLPPAQARVQFGLTDVEIALQ